jgi:hypothetical protein
VYCCCCVVLFNLSRLICRSLPVLPRRFLMTSGYRTKNPRAAYQILVPVRTRFLVPPRLETSSCMAEDPFCAPSPSFLLASSKAPVGSAARFSAARSRRQAFPSGLLPAPSSSSSPCGAPAARGPGSSSGRCRFGSLGKIPLVALWVLGFVTGVCVSPMVTLLVTLQKSEENSCVFISSRQGRNVAEVGGGLLLVSLNALAV